MKPISLRRLVGLIGLSIAIATAVLVPAGFIFVGYTNQVSVLDLKARLASARLAKHIYAHSALWQYQIVTLAELLEASDVPTVGIRKRIRDAQDKLLLEEGSAPAAPSLARSAPIVVAGELVGRVEIETSLRGLFIQTGLVSLLSAMLGLAVYFAVRIFPLRVLDRTLGALEAANRTIADANRHFDAALNNMSQGLCMFGADHRLIVSNRRFAAMFGIPTDAPAAGLTLRQLLDLAVTSGKLTPGDTEILLESESRLIEEPQPGAFLWDLADGRSISVVHQPMSTGWVSTYLDVTERRQAEAKMSFMSQHDSLTLLPNRLLFRDKMEKAMVHTKRGDSFAILCLDLDHFKEVNDTLGHPIGDQLLIAVAERLRDCVRDTDTLARLGGDEFAILQDVIEQPTGASALARRMNEAIANPFEVDGHQVVIGVSIGIALAPADGVDPDQLLRNADMALYRAKAEGRGIYHFFEPAMDARMQARRALELDLRKGLAKQEFELFFQPIIRLDTREVSALEALLRWQHPERGMVGPNEFIPLAEEIGLIVPLGEWVLKQACSHAMSWPEDIKVTVNLSPVQFRSRYLVQSVMGALAHSGLPPDRLELEITESVLLQDSESNLATLHQLRSLGVGIAMDDFGTGYSSLYYLRSFPFDKIKIDRSFIGDVASDDEALAIVRAVTGLGSSLGIATTAEGVETQDQLERLRLEGCTEVQGYLFSPARPAGDVAALLEELNPREAARNQASIEKLPVARPAGSRKSA